MGRTGLFALTGLLIAGASHARPPTETEATLYALGVWEGARLSVISEQSLGAGADREAGYAATNRPACADLSKAVPAFAQELMKHDISEMRSVKLTAPIVFAARSACLSEEYLKRVWEKRE